MKKNITHIIVVVCFLFLSACSNLSYYLDAATGHLTLLNNAQPIDEILQQQNTDHKLRQQLIDFQQARDFASQYLYLPDNDSYREFSQLDRDYVVWNIVATNEFSTEPEEWCFLFVGCLTYRGYFEKHKVDAYAEELKQQQLDVYVSGVSAYSTLGWFDDPVVSSMLSDNEARRIGIVFHELAHQLMYRKGSTTFNESFARAVEEEGIKRWFEHNNKPLQLKQYKEDLVKSRQFQEMLLRTKNRLSALYSGNLTDQEKRQQKQQYLASIKQDYTRLKQQWGGYSGYDKWMDQELNNAHFVLVKTYHDLVPLFNNMLRQKENNLKAFYHEVKQLSELPDDKFERVILKKREALSFLTIE